MRRWWRSTIRVRLTLLYAGAFFLAGAILVALCYRRDWLRTESRERQR
jgi:hypothetical protein